MKQNNIIELGFISKKDFKETKYKDKLSSYEKKIDNTLEELKRLLELDKKLYKGKDYSPLDIINMSNYLHMMANHLQDCRDVLAGMSIHIDACMFEYAEEFDKENKDYEK